MNSFWVDLNVDFLAFFGFNLLGTSIYNLIEIRGCSLLLKLFKPYLAEVLNHLNLADARPFQRCLLLKADTWSLNL